MKLVTYLLSQTIGLQGFSAPGKSRKYTVKPPLTPDSDASKPEVMGGYRRATTQQEERSLGQEEHHSPAN